MQFSVHDLETVFHGEVIALKNSRTDLRVHRLLKLYRERGGRERGRKKESKQGREGGKERERREEGEEREKEKQGRENR